MKSDTERTDSRNTIVELIFSVVAAYLKVGNNVFENKSRHRNIVTARQYGIYYLRKLLEMNVTEIGDLIKFNHSTICYHLKTIDNLLKYNHQTQKDIKELDGLLDFKILSTIPSEEFDDYFYYINLNDCKSIKVDRNKSLVFIGYSEEEIIKMTGKLNLDNSIPIKNHKQTQLYILNKRVALNESSNG